MNILHTRKQLLVFFMPGFLLGILYVNVFMKPYFAEYGIFSESFLEQYQRAEVVIGEYLLYLLQVRGIPFLILLGLAFTKFRKPAAIGCLLWTGFSGGMILTLAVMSRGIKGSILCIAGLFPHFLCYVPAYVVLLWYAYTFPQNRWNRQKTFFLAVMMIGGILLEGYAGSTVMRVLLQGL